MVVPWCIQERQRRFLSHVHWRARNTVAGHPLKRHCKHKNLAFSGSLLPWIPCSILSEFGRSPSSEESPTVTSLGRASLHGARVGADVAGTPPTWMERCRIGVASEGRGPCISDGPDWSRLNITCKVARCKYATSTSAMQSGAGSTDLAAHMSSVPTAGAKFGAALPAAIALAGHKV